MSNEGKALFKELELDKNPAVTLNVCDVQVLSDESGDNKIGSIDNPAAFITLLEEAENTGKENLTVTINAESDDLTDHDNDSDILCIDCNRSRWNVSQSLGYARNCSLKSLTCLLYTSPSPRDA